MVKNTSIEKDQIVILKCENTKRTVIARERVRKSESERGRVSEREFSIVYPPHGGYVYA